MKLFNGLTAGVSLAAFMSLTTPAQASDLLGSESLDNGYEQTQDKKDDAKKKKKKGDKGKEEGQCGADKGKHEGEEKKGDKEGSCGEGTCG